MTSSSRPFANTFRYAARQVVFQDQRLQFFYRFAHRVSLAQHINAVLILCVWPRAMRKNGSHPPCASLALALALFNILDKRLCNVVVIELLDMFNTAINHRSPVNPVINH